MEIKKGIGVSPGVAISTAIVFDAENLVIPRRQVLLANIDAELSRFDLALKETIRTLTQQRDDLIAHQRKEIAGIIDFHIGVLNDASLTGQIVAEIRDRHSSAEYAVSAVMRNYAAVFSKMTDRYLAERVKDIHDIERQLLHCLMGQQRLDLSHLTSDVVIIAHDLLPSQTASLDKLHVKGFATDAGGRTSHTAIVARAMGIPAIVGLGNITGEVSAGDTVIIDGNHGVVIINPDEQAVAENRGAELRRLQLDSERATLQDLPAQTLDGHLISLMANIEFPAEVDEALRRGAEGIGLYRTEYLYLASDHEPSEDEHYGAYADALLRLKNRPLVIRTLDLGADKYSQAKAAIPERNPFLGERSIRMCLHDIPMFKRQLRAIMRASVLGDVRVMFPMITTLMELRQARMLLNDVMEELEDEGVSHNRDIPVGMMIEVPSAALMADKFAKEVNFFSIGTNDLIQYTLAVDRTNERVAGLFCPGHPAVLGLVRDVIRKAARSISVSMCGEMAGEPLYTLLLLGLGLTTFSMNAPDIPEVKKIVRSTTMEHARQVARRVMSFDSERQVMHYLRDETRKIDPEAF
ncbi:MAG: phosphoenolpyruvate--protein phosphotransferase [Tepidisphaeraceae bacterium]|jgi:phosphotransferase system enzyme I (PtsI)